MTMTVKSLWKKFSIFVLILAVLFSLAGTAGAYIGVVEITVEHYYDNDPPVVVLENFTQSIYGTPVIDFADTKGGSYTVTGTEVYKPTFNVTVNAVLIQPQYSQGNDMYTGITGYDLQSIPLQNTAAVSPDASFSSNKPADSDVLDKDNSGFTLRIFSLGNNDVEIDAVTGEATISYYYFSYFEEDVAYYPGGANAIKSGLESVWDGSNENTYEMFPFDGSVTIDDLYDFNQGEVLRIYYESGTPSYAYVHTIHNYDGVIIGADDDDNCIRDEDKVTADTPVNLGDRIAAEYNNMEYAVESITIQYETTRSGYYGNVEVYSADDWVPYSEVMVVGDTFSTAEFINRTTYPETDKKISEYFGEKGLSLVNYIQSVTRDFFASLEFSATYPITGGPITYFKNERVEIENTPVSLLDFENPTYTFDENLHYIMTVTYKSGVPVTHHYDDGGGEKIFEEGKIVAFGTQTFVEGWNRTVYEEETYVLERIEIVEAADTLSVRHYDDGYNLIEKDNYTVFSGQNIPVYSLSKYFPDHPGLYFTGSYNTNTSDDPSEDERVSKAYHEVGPGSNILNLFYSVTIQSYYVIVSPDNSYKRSVWTGSDMPDANCTFAEDKYYEVHFYYVKSGTAADYKVTYDGNGNTAGTAPVDPLSYPAGSYATVLFHGDLVKTNAEFSHWNTAADGSGDSYYPGVSFADKVLVNSDVTLYAQWAGDIPVTHFYYTNGVESAEGPEYKSVTWDTDTYMTEWPVADFPNEHFSNPDLEEFYRVDKIVIREKGSSEPASWWVIRHFRDEMIGTQFDGSNTTIVYDSTIIPRDYVDPAYDTGAVYHFRFNNSYNRNSTPGDLSNGVYVIPLFTPEDRSTNVNEELQLENEGANYINLLYSLVPGAINSFIVGNNKLTVITDDFEDPNDAENNLSNPHFTFEYGKEYEVEIYYSLYGAEHYTVTYDANGGTGDVPVDYLNPYSEGATVTVLKNTDLVRDSYEFVGWVYDEENSDDNDGTVYGEGQTFVMPADNVTLYAKWIRAGHTVTFNAMGGTFEDPVSTTSDNDGVISGSPANEAGNHTFVASGITDGSKITAPTPAPVKDDYALVHWYYKDGETSKIWYFDSAAVTRDITLYAAWGASSESGVPLMHYYGKDGTVIPVGPEQKTVGYGVPTDLTGWPVIDYDGDTYQVDKIVIKEWNKWWEVRAYTTSDFNPYGASDEAVEYSFYEQSTAVQNNISYDDLELTVLPISEDPVGYTLSDQDPLTEGVNPWEQPPVEIRYDDMESLLYSDMTQFNMSLQDSSINGPNYLTFFYYSIAGAVNTFTMFDDVLTVTVIDGDDLETANFTFKEGKRYEVEVHYSFHDAE